MEEEEDEYMGNVWKRRKTNLWEMYEGRRIYGKCMEEEEEDNSIRGGP